MKCCSQCEALEKQFDMRYANRELREYQRHGASATTKRLIEAVRQQIDVRGKTLLDIGGGVGAIQHDLLRAGAAAATDVDASGAYIAAAKSEAARQGHAEKVAYQHGNFVDLAPEVDAADVVTLDRVVCCYPDMPSLVGLSAARARQVYGLVFPNDNLLMKAAARLINFIMALRRDNYRFFVHPTEAVDTVVGQHGLQSVYQQRGLIWQVRVYRRG